MKLLMSLTKYVRLFGKLENSSKIFIKLKILQHLIIPKGVLSDYLTKAFLVFKAKNMNHDKRIYRIPLDVRYFNLLQLVRVDTFREMS